MAFTLDDRAALRRAFYRMLAIAPMDDAVSEHDSEAEETINYFIQHGLWNAQAFLITNTDTNRWATTSGALTILGSDSTGGRYVSLPDDHLRLAGNYERSAFFDAGNQNRRWGELIDPREKRGARGNVYWVENNRIYFGLNANLPSGLEFDYFFRHEVLDNEDDTIDFPLELRPLIVAEAAILAFTEAWMPFDDQATEARLHRNLSHWQRQAASRSRRTRRPQQLRSEPNQYGSNWL